MSDAVAFLYPGQGSVPEAPPPMSDRIRRLYARAEQRGVPVAQWIDDRAVDRLDATEHAQPVLYLDSVARDEALRAVGWTPDAVAGHSLGEYAALTGAGALDASAGLDAVVERGRRMAGIAGAMAAVLKLDLATVEALCRAVGDEVVVANHNASDQIVVSGTEPSVEELARRAERKGGRTIRLSVSGPFHSPRMAGAQDALEPTLRRLPFSTPTVPVVSAVTGTAEWDPERLRELLCRQITARVRWVDVVERLRRLDIVVAVEVGSGDVLTRLGRRTTDDIRFLTYKEAFDERD